MGGPAWRVYIVVCRTGEIYTGCTVDLERRIRQHNAGTASKFTRTRRPVTLVYQELCGNRSAALRREHQIKRMSKTEKVALVAKAQTASATAE